MTAKSEIDESYYEWEPVERYTHWLVARTIKKNWDRDALQEQILELQSEVKLMFKTDDSVCRHSALELSVMIRLLRIASMGRPIFLETTNPDEVMSMHLLGDCLNFHAKTNPFPLKLADGLFTVITEHAQKASSQIDTKGFTYMELAKSVFVMVQVVAVTKLVEFERTKWN